MQLFLRNPSCIFLNFFQGFDWQPSTVPFQHTAVFQRLHQTSMNPTRNAHHFWAAILVRPHLLETSFSCRHTPPQQQHANIFHWQPQRLEITADISALLISLGSLWNIRQHKFCLTSVGIQCKHCKYRTARTWCFRSIERCRGTCEEQWFIVFEGDTNASAAEISSTNNITNNDMQTTLGLMWTAEKQC